MKTYRECYFEPRKLVSDKWDHYFEIYDQCFDRHRRTTHEPTYVEIGCQRGGSLEVAKRYFGANSRVFGVDIDPSCEVLNKEDFVEKVFIGSQSNPQFLEAALKQIGTPDIVVDDGSHQSSDMIISFLCIFPKLSQRGTYLIEDVCCSYFPGYQSLFYGLSVVDFFKGLTEKLTLNSRVEQFVNSRFMMPPAQREGKFQLKTGVVKDIRSVQFYDSVIVIEKGDQEYEPMRHVR
jgi:23S rRNA U2552 (ribose-2'-O)-methylase RlmE/FtsJ